MPKSVVILQSVRAYAAARAGAKQASAQLGRLLKLAGYQPNKELDWSASQANCTSDGDPCAGQASSACQARPPLMRCWPACT